MSATSFRLLKGFGLLILFLSSTSVHSQLKETFSDGDFLNNPTWCGDTAHFRINSNGQLQLYSHGPDSVQLSVPYSLYLSDSLSWEFWIKLSFSPTANNYAVVALFSDSSNLLSASHYLSLAVADPSLSPSKRISLYYDDSLLFASDFRLLNSVNQLRVKVLYLHQDSLQLWFDTIGNTATSSFVKFASIDGVDISPLPQSAFFGWFCRFTASRSRLFFLDDIAINTPLVSDSSSLRFPNPGDVIINEILFNPTPDGADYVELFNRSDSPISLSSLRLAQLRNGHVSHLYRLDDSFVLNPSDFVVLTTNAATVRQLYFVRQPANLLQVASLPPFPDKAGIVILTNSDSLVIDSLAYSESMHSPLLRDKQGVALERRSTSAPTNIPTNWYSASSISGFGTPTASNSQSSEILFLDNDFHLDKSLFSPDNDGYNDILLIDYALSLCDLSANATIFSSSGRPVRHLFRGALLGCSGSFSWDGRDDAGRVCCRGNYILVVEAFNTSGTKQQWRRRVSLVTN